MQTKSSNENSVRPSVCVSVCPPVKRVDCDKTEERSVQIFIPYERPVKLLIFMRCNLFYTFMKQIPCYVYLMAKYCLLHMSDQFCKLFSLWFIGWNKIMSEKEVS